MNIAIVIGNVMILWNNLRIFNRYSHSPLTSINKLGLELSLQLLMHINVLTMKLGKYNLYWLNQRAQFKAPCILATWWWWTNQVMDSLLNLEVVYFCRLLKLNLISKFDYNCLWFCWLIFFKNSCKFWRWENDCLDPKCFLTMLFVNILFIWFIMFIYANIKFKGITQNESVYYVDKCILFLSK
jgi:hypothetical protein